MISALHRVGKYEFREPDYRQILIWAKALDLEPVEIVKRIEEGHSDDSYEWTPALRVENGVIVSLTWDFDLLPLVEFQWVDGLLIRHLIFNGSPAVPPRLSLRLPRLDYLSCVSLKLSKLDISFFPNLTHLYCGGNRLTELDLSN